MNTASEVKQTAWGATINNLTGEITNLKDRLECLASRIDPILSPSQPTNTGKGTQPMPPKARIIMEIDSEIERIKELRNIINELIQRLEV